MKPHLHLHPLIQSLIAIMALSSSFQTHHCKLECNFKKCTRPFRCGDVEALLYPFWGHNRPYCCGHPKFRLWCTGNDTVLSISTQSFRVIKLNETNSTVRIARRDLRRACPDQNVPYANTTLSTLFRYTSRVQNISVFYECPQDKTTPWNYFSCRGNQTRKNGYFVDQLLLGDQLSDDSDGKLKACGVSFLVPLLPAVHGQLLAGKMSFIDALRYGVDVKYNANRNACRDCMRAGGMCATDSKVKFFCYGVPVTVTSPSPTQMEKAHHMRFVAGGGIAVGALGLTCIAVFALRSIGRTLSSNRMESIWKLKSKNIKGFEQIFKQNGLAPKRYRYTEVKKMTNSFKDKLGEGGYGIVYEGRLRDGQPVAVKILNKSKGNGEEFVNEVAIISRTSHVNIVSLLGFCFDGSKRALIYEYMANGSLEKFIYNRSTSTAAGRHLGWEHLYEIALGIARGLEYLHRGCNARILHFDIKPHNILLDEDFHPKISDFGLAKLCSTKGSIVPIKDTRGTAGYIAPEVFNRMFGQVTHKSDVYSYGMMVLEMVGGRKNVDEEGENSSKRHFPSWVYKHLQQGCDLVLSDIMNMEENDIAKKMLLVGLWCIQTNASNRPSIKEVIDMLEGSIAVLELPPNPFICSSS